MRDLCLAIRDLVATPVVSLAASVSLALGIGATTAVFSVINGLLLRPLPVDHPERLVTISSDYAISYGFTAGAGWNYAMWDRLQQRAQAFDGALAWAPQRFDLSERGETEPVDGVFASGSFFSTLGVNAQIGRVFTSADDVPGAGPVVVISHALWQRRFGGGHVIGLSLALDHVPCTIIGVAPREFSGLEVGRPFEVALPLRAEPSVRRAASVLNRPQNLFLIVMLRLKAGQSVASATSILRAMQPDMLSSLRVPEFVKQPFTLVPAAAGTSGAAVGGGGLRQRYQRPLLTIFVVTALVLVVACMNIANLQLARATARTYEMSVRVAIGATRWRLARQLLVESLVLATIGALVGTLFAIWGSRILVAQLSTRETHVLLNLSLDWRVAGFAAAVTGATVLLFGMAPAVRASRADPIALFRRQPHGGSGGGLSSLLVIGQIAFSMVLVVAAGLFVRSFDRLTNVPLGFDPDRVLVVTVNAARVPVDPAGRLALFRRLVDAVASLPGVERAAGSKWTPIAGGGRLPLRVDVPGAQNLFERERSSLVNVITPGWFATYGTPIRAGRDFQASDVDTASPVAIVNDAFVRRFVRDRDPLDVSITIPADSGGAQTRAIVGVVADAVYSPSRVQPSIGSLALREAVPPTVYVPLTEDAGIGPPNPTDIRVSIRAQHRPATLAASVGARLTAIDRNLTYTFRPLADDVSAAQMQERLVARLSSLFGVLSLLLAAVGIFGLTLYGVSRRRAEIAIRMALGAVPASVVRLFLGRIAALLTAGMIVGVSGSFWLSGYIATLLYDIRPRDPVTFAGAASLLAFVAAVAACLPAYRASRVPPAEVLRHN